MKKSMFVLAENQEEFNELFLICKNLYKLNKNINFYFIDVSNIVDTKLSYSNKDNVFKEYIKINKKFKNLKILNKLFAIYKINKIIKSKEQEINNVILLSGVPLVFFRYLHIFYGYTFFSYLRSLVIEEETTHSLSHKIFKIFKNFFNKQSKLFKIINPWVCSYLFTIGSINKEYLFKYLPNDKIILSGPLLLDELKKKCIIVNNINLNKINKLIFATSAFSWHLEYELDKLQYNILDNILLFLNENKLNLNFIIRIHPRDDIKKYQSLKEKYKNLNIEFNNEPFLDFIGDCIYNSVLFSLISNLNLEWSYLGGKSIYIGNDFLLKKYKYFFNKINYSPYIVDKVEDFYFLKDFKELNYINVKNIYSLHKEGNLNFLIKNLRKFIL